MSILSGCEKSSVSEDEIASYYETNKQNSLNKLFPMGLMSGSLNTTDTETKPSFHIVHISDAHLSPWSSNNSTRKPSNLLEAVQFANEPTAGVNVTVDTGDHIGNSIQTTRTEALSYLDAYADALYTGNKIPTLACTGNHDANMLDVKQHPEYALSKMDMYNHLTSKTNYPIHTEGIQNYYYADVVNPAGGVVRIIALDVMDQEGTAYDAQFYAVLSQRQIDWFCHTALKENMTENHSVIVLIHYPLSNNDEIKSYVSSEFVYSWKLIPDIIEAFRSKHPLTAKYRNRFDASDSVAVNVSFKDAPGEFICYMGGHIHTYLNYEIEGFNNLNPALPKQIMLIANNLSPSDKSPKSPISRNSVGLLNNTFNIYSIDTARKIIRVFFFGATGYYIQNVIELNYL
jgi:predicted MPP superfamily phosphohydrolase